MLGIHVGIISLLVLAQHAVCARAAAAETPYVLGAQGESCATTCGRQGRTCLNHITTHDTTAAFLAAGVNCSKPSSGPKWWAPDQPSFVSDPSDPNVGECLGYINVPTHVICQGAYETVRRLCNCGVDDTGALTFGTGLSGGRVTTTETTIFAHAIKAGSLGVMNHFWSTCSPEAEKDLLVRYYLDGEAAASIEFKPPMAAGVGFDDAQKAPWGTKWFGLGAGKGGNGQAWFNNFKIPFQKSVRVTVQHASKDFGGFYIIVRGSLDVPLEIGGVTLPKTARMQLQKFEGGLKPLEYMNVSLVPPGFSGQFFMSTLSVENEGVGGLNFLEGCYHMYDGKVRTSYHSKRLTRQEHRASSTAKASSCSCSFLRVWLRYTSSLTPVLPPVLPPCLPPCLSDCLSASFPHTYRTPHARRPPIRTHSRVRCWPRARRTTSIPAGTSMLGSSRCQCLGSRT